MEEIIFSLKHYWRFVDLEALALHALSEDRSGESAWKQANVIARKTQAPALSVPQARSLLAVALREQVLDLERALESVRYHQARNYAAYRSHQKCTLQIYRQHQGWP